MDGELSDKSKNHSLSRGKMFQWTPPRQQGEWGINDTCERTFKNPY